MNDVERAKLVELLGESWPLTGPKPRIWHEVLADLDHAHAHRAYLRMRDTLSRVSVADFLERYRDSESASLAAQPRTPCKHCDDTGWVSARPRVYTVNGRRHESRQAVPCPACATGAARQRVHRQMVEESRARHPAAREIEDVQSELL